MAIAVHQFDRIAEAVAQKTSDILSADAAVVDEMGVIVASNRHEMVGSRFESVLPHVANSLRIPLNLDGHAGEIVLTKGDGSQRVPERGAHDLVDLIVNHTALVDSLPTNAQLKNKFIHDLLLGDVRADESIVREAQVLGMDLTPPRAVILIDASSFILPDRNNPGDVEDEFISRRAQKVITSVVGFFDLPSDTICAYIGGGEVAVLKASSSQDLFAWTEDEEGMRQWVPSWANLTALKRAVSGLLARVRCDTRSNITIGIGRYHPGICGLAGSYRDARAALRLGSRFQGHNQFHCLDNLGVAAFVGVADEATKVDLAHHLLSPLDHEPELIETLEVFFAHDCSASFSANQLCIHRNTLAYRLDKISSLTGLDPRRFDDAVQIRVALTLRSLAETG